ncbi:hypothetical protein Aduo_001606 [Ancylostoma duodenale]
MMEAITALMHPRRLATVCERKAKRHVPNSLQKPRRERTLGLTNSAAAGHATSEHDAGTSVRPHRIFSAKPNANEKTRRRCTIDEASEVLPVYQRLRKRSSEWWHKNFRNFILVSPSGPL